MRKNRWKNLDVLNISLNELKAELIIFVNSSFFFRSKKSILHKEPNSYEKEGLLELVWSYVYEKNYKKASLILNSITNDSNDSLFAKFVVSLFQGEDAFSYLKECIEKKQNSKYDSEYQLYLEIYKRMTDYDADSLLDLLNPVGKIVAFNSNSYLGNYLEFQKLLNDGQYKKASKKLLICKKMNPNSIHIEILLQLVSLLIKDEAEKLKKKRKMELELEQERCQKFIELIKEKDFKNAKEQVEKIISYRNNEKQNNYVYQLFLEILETYFTFSKDITFEIPEFSYTYQKQDDSHYTFLEAISLGDFRTALKVGKKCKNKAIDPSIPKLKVGLYLIVLEQLFTDLTSREKKQEHLYYIVQNNIQRGHFIHALELYQNNRIVLENYQSNILLDLFQTGIAIERKEINFHDLYNQDILVEEETVQLELPIEPKGEDNVESSPKEEVVEEEKEPHKEDVKAEVFYPVEPLLVHTEPNQEYFLYYSKCMEYGQYDEARYWLTQYGAILKENQLKKRLDHHFYTIEVSRMESLEEGNLVTKKEELYQMAYSSMRNYEYEKSITYLEYYAKMDTCRNNKALILKGYVYTRMGKYQSAIKCFIEANSISPNPDAYYYLGEIYYKMHRWKDAIFCYITYNEFYPKENLTVYLNLSECYRKLNNSKKSLKYLKIADELNLNQNRGLNLKNRILRAEMMNQKKEKFHLEKKAIEG